MTIKDRRKALGLTREQAAALARVDSATWQNWETGRCRPRPAFRGILCAVIDVTDDELSRIIANTSRDASVEATQFREQSNDMAKRHGVTLAAICEYLNVAYCTFDNWRRGRTEPPGWAFDRLAEFRPGAIQVSPPEDWQYDDSPHQLGGQDIRLMLMRWRGSEGRRSEPTGGVTPYAELAASDAAWGGA